MWVLLLYLCKKCVRRSNEIVTAESNFEKKIKAEGSTFWNWNSHITIYRLFLFEVEEIVTTTEVDEESFEEIYRQTKRSIPMLFVRGDAVILVSPPARATWFYHWSHFHFSGNIHDFMFYFTMKINYFSMLLVITLRIGYYVKHEHVWDLVFSKINAEHKEAWRAEISGLHREGA